MLNSPESYWKTIENDQNLSRLEWGEIENEKEKEKKWPVELPVDLLPIENDEVIPKIKFNIRDISDKLKEKLFKMTENELKENGINSIDEQVSFLIKNAVEEKSLKNGLSPEKAKELGQEVKIYHESLFMTLW